MIGKEERRIRRLLARLARDESAATAIEYAIVASGIAMAVVVAVYGLRDALIDNYYSKLGGNTFNP
jgi:pilus assembly protein Flp/PilA